MTERLSPAAEALAVNNTVAMFEQDGLTRHQVLVLILFGAWSDHWYNHNTFEA